MGPNPALLLAPDNFATSPVQLSVESDEVDENSLEFGAAFQHDTMGFAPGPIGPGFVKCVKQISLGVGVSYLNAWRGSVSYTNGFGGGIHNGTADRDFVAASVSYAF